MIRVSRIFGAAGLIGAVALVGIGVTAAGAGGSATYKPVIGNPVSTPAKAFAGKPFAVAFRVTRSDTGTPLTKGRMTCDPSVSGKVLAHAESFKAGKARLAFGIPATAQGKLLKVKVTIQATGGGSATRVATFRVLEGAKPTLSISGASVAEGNAGTTSLSFTVALSAAGTQPVSVAYATSDGTATAPADYAAANGTVTLQPGELSKPITVGVVGDLAMEQDETLTVTLSNPVNATIAAGSATGTITNDDTAVPVTAGSYKGATQEGNHVFFTVTPSRTVTDWRVNDLPCPCSPGGILRGGENFSDSSFTIGPDGSFRATGDWTGSERYGSMELLHWDAKLTGLFVTPTSVTGTILVNYVFNSSGTRYTCSSGDKKWSATLQG